MDPISRAAQYIQTTSYGPLFFRYWCLCKRVKLEIVAWERVRKREVIFTQGIKTKRKTRERERKKALQQIAGAGNRGINSPVFGQLIIFGFGNLEIGLMWNTIVRRGSAYIYDDVRHVSFKYLNLKMFILFHIAMTKLQNSSWSLYSWSADISRTNLRTNWRLGPLSPLYNSQFLVIDECHCKRKPKDDKREREILPRYFLLVCAFDGSEWFVVV